jgi:acetyl esterase/lipase
VEDRFTFHASLPGSTTGANPEVTFFKPEAGTASGHALVVFAGGGYAGRSAHEGPGCADWFAARGVAAFDVAYRVGTTGARHPAMLEDALAAIRTVRERASLFEIDPAKIGVTGSSAGGHLAAHAMTAHGDYPSAISARPDFGILSYPVLLTDGPHAHGGSMLNLLGPDPSPELLRSVNPVLRIDANTPPTFLWHTVEDGAVPVRNSLAFADRLNECGVPFELHCYETGRHGLGLRTEHAWYDAALRWVRRR